MQEKGGLSRMKFDLSLMRKSRIDFSKVSTSKIMSLDLPFRRMSCPSIYREETHLGHLDYLESGYRITGG